MQNPKNWKDEGHVLGNANFSPRRQNTVFTHIQSFFSEINMTIVSFKLTAIASIKNHSQGIYEKRWHIYDLRKESCADGGLGRPILGEFYLFKNIDFLFYDSVTDWRMNGRIDGRANTSETFTEIKTSIFPCLLRTRHWRTDRPMDGQTLL